MKRCLRNLDILSTERLTPNALGHLDSRNQHHRQLTAQKVDAYFATRQRMVYLQQQSTQLAAELVQQRQLVQDLKRQLSKESSKAKTALTLRQKKENDLRLAIGRAEQRIQRRLRHVRRSS